MPLIASVIAAALASFLALALSIASRRGGPPGLIGDQLAPCPTKPNAVSSETEDTARRVEPFGFDVSPEAAWQALAQTVRADGGKIRSAQANYMWATFSTRLWRFVDDVEFRLDPAHRCIHVRSASRVGYADFGANRRRIEKLRRRFSRIASEA